MIFYLTAPDYLALERTNVPLFVNHYALFGGRSKRLPKALGPWCLDSGGYTQLKKKENKGKWPFSHEKYVADVRRCVKEIGNLRWAAIMDWMTEDEVLAQTGLDVREHQYRTIDSYLELRRLGGPEMEHLWLPVLQGRCPEDYIRHYQMYMNEGIALEQVDWVGVGSVCRLGDEERISEVFGVLNDYGLYRLHAFGLKSTGLTWKDIETRTTDPDLNAFYKTMRDRGLGYDEIEEMFQVRDVTTWERVSREVCHLIRSADSNAWSFRASRHGTGVYRARNDAFGYNQWVAYKGSLWRYAGTQPAGGSNTLRLKASGLREKWSKGRLVSKTEPVLGEELGQIKHEQAWPMFPGGGPESDPFTPTQMMSSCSVNASLRDRGEDVTRHERCVSDLDWALAWRANLAESLTPIGCWHEEPQFGRLPAPPFYPPEKRAADTVARLTELGLWPPGGPPPPPPTSGPQLTLFNPYRRWRSR